MCSSTVGESAVGSWALDNGLWDSRHPDGRHSDSRLLDSRLWTVGTGQSARDSGFWFNSPWEVGECRRGCKREESPRWEVLGVVQQMGVV